MTANHRPNQCIKAISPETYENTRKLKSQLCFKQNEINMNKNLIFGRPKTPIDFLPNDPYKAIEEVWHHEDVSEMIHGHLTNWFYMALSHGGTVYKSDDFDIRASLIAFYADLIPFIEAMFCFDVDWEYYQKHKKSPDYDSLVLAIKERLCHDYSCIYLDKDEMTNPRSVFAAFCLKYP